MSKLFFWVACIQVGLILLSYILGVALSTVLTLSVISTGVLIVLGVMTFIHQRRNWH